MRRLTAVISSAVVAMAIAAPSALAADPPDNGNCLSSFVNGGSQGGQVSGDPGGAQASHDLGAFLHETRGRC
jgi:hypothetical protein